MRSSDPTKGPREIPFPFSLLFLPLLLVAGLLSYPTVAILWTFYTLKEWRFVRKMKLSSHVMSESEYAAAVEHRRGTLIEEWFSLKGPVRCWWTEDDVPSATELKWTDSGIEAVVCREYDEFSSWCYAKYIEAINARLVWSSYVPETVPARIDKEAAFPIPVVAIYHGKFSRKKIATA